MKTSTPTICIPHVELNTTHTQVEQAITRLGIGRVVSVRIIPSNTFAYVFVQMEWDLSIEKAQVIHKRLMKGKAIKVLYGEDLETTPWFWKCVSAKIQ